MRADVAGIGRIFLYLFPQLTHELPNHPLACCIVTPDCFLDFFIGNHSAGVLDQVGQELKLAWRQHGRPALDPDVASLSVDPYIADELVD